MDAYWFEGHLFQMKDSPLLSCAPFAEMKSCEALFAGAVSNFHTLSI